MRILRKLKKTAAVLFALAFTISLAACSAQNTDVQTSTSGRTAVNTSSANNTVKVTNTANSSLMAAISVKFDSYDTNTDVGSTDVANIKFNGNSAEISGKGVQAEGSKVTITSGGTYNISGTLNDGQIIVNSAESKVVRLILNQASITCSNSAPIYVMQAEKTVITLADGTENVITDANTYANVDPESGEPNAAIFSKDDLTINGSGSLTVNANCNNGITSKDDLKISSGNITVNAANDGIKGRNYIAVKDGNININAKADGMQSNNDEDAEKGFVYIEGGTIQIFAGQDGIQGQTDVAVNGGNITIACEDDGIHADATIAVNNGEINITKCYEGIESAVITLNGGDIRLVASDDGINVAGGNDGSSMNGRPGQNNFAVNSNNRLDINGGYVAVNADGDGIDVNGSIYMTNGTVIVQGPTANNNGALDCDGTFEVTGGWLLAVGSGGMAETPGESSKQYTMAMTFAQTQQAGTMVHVETKDGRDILTFLPAKPYQSVVLCSSELKNGSSYVVYLGGSSTGTQVDGLFSGGKYTAGTQAADFTVSGIVTRAGVSMGGNMGGMDGGMGGGGGGGMGGGGFPAGGPARPGGGGGRR